MIDEDLETLREHLYQLSLGKVPAEPIDRMAQIASKLWPNMPVGSAASHALALAELRQDLASAEDNRHAHAATGLKRKIDLLEDLLLRQLEKMR